MNFKKDIQILLSSNNYLIYVETQEEERLEHILNITNDKQLKKNICNWNFIDGYMNNPNYIKKGKKNPLEALDVISHNKDSNIEIFFLKDFYHFINDISISRKLKNTAKWLKKYKKYIIISGQGKQIPYELKEYITYIKLPLPNKKEIATEINRFIDNSDNKYTEVKDNICTAYIGYTINRIRKSISQLIVLNLSETDIIQRILKEKEKIIGQTDILEFYLINKAKINVGGLVNLKKWLKVRQLTFTKRATTYGTKIPQGILLVGIQGTGKSLSAKAISTEWNLPLLKLNISKIFAGILGESENKINKAIETSESISPCILWIDEIDKVFTQNINNTDSGTTLRVTNIFLTWLSEKKRDVFVIATANNIHNLPIEILRKGRFDEIFFVDLPKFQERINIFQIHLKKVRPLTWYKYNIYYLSKISRKFSGAEIEQSITEAMYEGFYQNREFTTKDIEEAINKMIPLSITEIEKIDKLRKWGHSGKIRLA
uniref:Ycf46 n=1 Tax=Laurencia catarinensis TaxID=197326 RepID=UPI0028D822EA|nr:Ycf46 [Laurencia catarinensis]WMP12370.1 Ycf46 [Laurencia catarinensis]